MIYVVDFGSQTAHLIERRIKKLGATTKIIAPDEVLNNIKKEKPKGVILSGGPSSVYVKNAPVIDPLAFSLNIPVLGICYGLQIMAKELGGRVVSGKKEYGPTILKLRDESLKMKNKKNFSSIISHLSSRFTVWMSHGDEVLELPKGFKVLGSTENVKNAFVANFKKKIFGVQFHPEVEHTEFGLQILKNFLDFCDLGLRSENKEKFKVQSSKFKVNDSKKQTRVEEIRENIKKIVGDSYVIGAVSGGVDSTVAGILCADAIGKKFIPIYVENGLMRERTREHVQKIFKKHHVRPIVVNAVGETLKLLKGVSNSEKKRKIIGNLYIKLFEKEMKNLKKSAKNINFLMQGTIYSDVIESQGTRHASKIKSHHNVGGLPKKMKLKLLEPLRNFYKDEVREIGRNLGLADEFVNKQPFPGLHFLPGPGYAVRIRGEVTAKKLKKIKKADRIVLEELEKENLLSKVFQSFPVLTGASSTAVKGDGRFFGDVIALRVVESRDIMTSDWARLPYNVLQKISSRIVNEVDGVSRVVYDITTKPPATMEWE
ncbi:MAG: glutamine-hydrolyzing GMP synthase [Patescibacteria group bacterium]|nr:glutamine-hydrolyzing GMP synthase [Patescibacteria group bacterium]